MHNKNHGAKRPASALINQAKVFDRLEAQAKRLDFVALLEEGHPLKQASLDAYSRLIKADLDIKELQAELYLNVFFPDDSLDMISHPIHTMRSVFTLRKIREKSAPIVMNRFMASLSLTGIQLIYIDLERGRQYDEITDNIQLVMNLASEVIDSSLNVEGIPNPMKNSEPYKDMIGQLCFLTQISIDGGYN